MKNFFRKKITEQKGVTLLELIVALSLFSLIALSATQIFNTVVKAQRQIIYSQNMQKDMRFIMEVMTKEIRMAQVDQDGTCVDANKVYYTDGDRLDFLNVDGDCVRYYEDEGRLMLRRNGDTEAVTSEEVEIESLEFMQYGEVPLEQPRIVINMDIAIGGKAGMPQQKLDFQTSISTRHYE